MTDLGKLNYLEVSGFKSIEKSRIYLRDLNVLIGANGSEKSNFIAIFRFLHKTQIIASTQSVTLANQFSWDDLIVVDRVEDASRFRRLKREDVEQWLDDYALGELWEKSILGGTP